MGIEIQVLSLYFLLSAQMHVSPGERDPYSHLIELFVYGTIQFMNGQPPQ